MPWLQLKIHATREEAATFETIMLSNGALSVTFEDGADEPIYEPDLGETPLWFNTKVTGLFEADIDTDDVGKRILSLTGKTNTYKWEILEDKDWQREWLTHYKPIKCDDRFWVCPSTCEKPDPSAINLVLDPGLAFGTGTHPTTFLCLQWISKYELAGKSVIDYGCGSGILGIAALLHQAASVIGVDIDPQALTATSDNVKRNGLDPAHFPVYLSNKHPEVESDVVLANILAGPLVDLAPKLISLTKKGGAICLSGVLSSQKEAVITAYEGHVKIRHIFEKDEWVCITGTRVT